MTQAPSGGGASADVAAGASHRGDAAASASWPATLAVLGALLALVLLTYQDTFAEMARTWASSETFAHAYVVLPIALWLIWRRRAEVAAQAPRPMPVLLVPLAAAGVLWLLGHIAFVNAAMQFAAVGLVVLLVVGVIGWQAARPIAFPLGFLFFAVPFGEFLIPQMMVWTADFTVAALRATGVPVYREGLQLLLPTGMWSVVEACSGIRYLISSVMVGTLYAYLNYRSLRKRLLFVGVSFLVPILANWVRAYLIVLLGHLTDNKLAAGADHLIYGWVFFGVVILLMFLIGSRWSDPARTAAPLPTGRRMPGVARGRAAAAAFSLGALALAPGLAARSLDTAPDALARALTAPAAGNGWHLASEPPRWHPDFTGPAQVEQVYANAQGERVGLFFAYYARQSREHKLVSTTNELVKSANHDWSVLGAGIHPTGLPEGPREVWSAALRGSRDPGSATAPRIVVWRVYLVNGGFVASDRRAKIEGVLQRLRGQGDDGAVVVIHGTSETVLQSFLAAHAKALQSHLQNIRAARGVSLASNRVGEGR